MRVNRTPPHGLSPARGRMHLYSMIHIPFDVNAGYSGLPVA